LILLESEIREGLGSGRLLINPFNEDQLGPNSYDVRLAAELLCYQGAFDSQDRHWHLDMNANNPTESLRISRVGYVLKPGILYLASTLEQIGTAPGSELVPHITGRSSVGRLGMAVHITAGFGDVGFCAQWTLEITVVHPLRVYAGVRIAQAYFLEGRGATAGYQGRYQQQIGPTASRFHLKDK